MRVKSLGLYACLLSLIVTVPGLSSAVGVEFESNATTPDLILYSFHESNTQSTTYCSTGNTQNVLDTGAESGEAGINAIRIEPGGDCTFYTNTQQSKGTYHLQMRLRTETACTSGSVTTTITFRILTNFRSTDSLYYGVIVKDSQTLSGIPVTTGQTGSPKAYTGIDVSYVFQTDLRDFRSDSMASQINFKNNAAAGGNCIWLDALYISTTQ